MAYQSWSVVFGEQPSAAKWNIIGTNMAGFNDGTAIGNDAIQSKHIDWADTGSGDNGGIWWEEIGRTTLSVAGDTISISTIEVRKYLMVLYYIKETGGNITPILRFNNDSGANYAQRFSANGAADSASGSTTSIVAGTGTIVSLQIGEFYISNIATVEKTMQGVSTYGNTVGAANAPGRLEISGKWSNTSNAITRIDLLNAGTGDFAIGSEVVVLGHN